jgi:hypothetical protein
MGILEQLKGHPTGYAIEQYIARRKAAIAMETLAADPGAERTQANRGAYQELLALEREFKSSDQRTLAERVNGGE